MVGCLILGRNEYKQENGLPASLLQANPLRFPNHLLANLTRLCTSSMHIHGFDEAMRSVLGFSLRRRGGEEVGLTWTFYIQ